MTELRLADLVVLGVYLAGVLGIGLYCYFRVDRFAEYFDGGRRMGTILIALAVAATNIGAANTVGAVALAYREGVSAAWYVTLQALAFVPFALLAVPKIYPLTQTTLSEWLELRYHAWLRPVSAGALALATFAILPAQIVGGASVVVTLTGVDYTYAFLGVGLALLVYTSLGGFASVVYTDALQWGMLVTGFVVAIPLVLAGTGGISGLRASVPASHADWLTGATGNWDFFTILAWSLTVLVARFGAQEWYQRVRAGRSAAVAQRGLIWGGLAAAPFGVLTMLIGVAALDMFPALSDPEQAFAQTMMGVAPAGLRALVMGAILAAVMSSGDSGVNAATALFVNDVCRPNLPARFGDRFYLRLSQVASATLGLGALLLALTAPAIIEYIRFGFLVRTPLAIVVIAGLFWRFPTALGAGLGVVAGTLSVLGWQLFGSPRVDPFWIGAPVTLAALSVGSRLGREPRRLSS